MVKIIGTGSYVPEKIITNKDLECLIDTNDSWVQENIGIKERRIASPNETTSDLAANAAMKAIEYAGISVDEIDLIIVATTTPDRKAPPTACILQDKIKAYNSVAFDINAVCAGFLVGMATANNFLMNRTYTTALLVGVDVFSRITDWSKRDAVYFGDGAGAIVMRYDKYTDFCGFRHLEMLSDGRGKDDFTVPYGGTETPITKDNIHERNQFFKMYGRGVYNKATSVLPIAVEKCLKATGLTINDICMMIPHQPSVRTLKKVAELIRLPQEKLMMNMEYYGNTASASIPLLLDQVNRKNKIKDGEKILFAAIGSGWTWGAGIYEW
jgi:3-oxoacyl-[acyl-carrier-protein] synthase-3